jgi:subtilisin family serine protease
LEKQVNKKISIVLAVIVLAIGATPASAGIQSSVSSWSLDRLDQATTTLDGSYNYPDSAGAGVRVYVLDTGVESKLVGFEGRVATGFDAIARFKDPSMANIDCNGHGTHIAGIIASATYGVAKKATIVPVRVASCEGGVFPESIAKGIDWVIKNHPRNTSGVVNISLAVNKSKIVDDAIARLFRAGLVAVVSAGNQNIDACRLSPASSKNALTVGSVNMNDQRTNTSNFGECVSIFAPGGLVPSEGVRGVPSTRSGTSMAAAHATGVVALYLANNPRALPNVVIGEVIRNGLGGIVIDAKSVKGNVLLNAEFLNR